MKLVADIPLSALEVLGDPLAVDRAAEIYRRFGVVVARGLMRDHVGDLLRDAQALAEQSRGLLELGSPRGSGRRTPDGSLFYRRADGLELVVLGLTYLSSAAALRSAMSPSVLDLMEQLLGPDVELFGNGHSHVKDANEGHVKALHQDSAYYHHRHQGPIAVLTYLVDCDRDNGALCVVPGSHALGTQPHHDSASDLALDVEEWPWAAALEVPGRAGDSIIYHVDTVHGSLGNRTPSMRPVFINRYRRADDYMVAAGASRAALEESRRAGMPDRNEQQGLMVRGRRRYLRPEEG